MLTAMSSSPNAVRAWDLRSRSRQRARCGPVLPTGMCGIALPELLHHEQQTFCPASSASWLLSWDRAQIGHTCGAYRATIWAHALGSLPAARGDQRDYGRVVTHGR